MSAGADLPPILEAVVRLNAALADSDDHSTVHVMARDVRVVLAWVVGDPDYQDKLMADGT